MVASSVRGVCLAVLSLAVVCSLAIADPKTKDKSKGDPDRKDDLKGRARWEWVIRDDKGKDVENGTFMGYVNGDIYHGKEKIGTFTIPAKNQVKVTFVNGKLIGTCDMQLKIVRPATFEGDLIRKDGTKQKLSVRIFND